MEAVVAIIAAGIGAMWWQRRRWTRAHQAFLATLDTDASVALHVAQHEARTRGHATLTSYHLLHGALQVEAVAEAIARCDGDLAALEDRVQRALDGHVDDERVLTDDAQHVLSHLHGVAAHNDRLATPADLWSSLVRSEAVTVLRAGGLDGRRVLMTLVHGATDPEPPATGADVLVVLRNDDHTPHDFVVRELREVFGQTEAEARALATQVHTEGRGIVCRAPAAEAGTKIARVRTHATEHGFPLWIATEPA